MSLLRITDRKRLERPNLDFLIPRDRIELSLIYNRRAFIKDSS